MVSDTGIGIAEDQQALLFAPFAQARQERPGRFGGTGLGLTICRRLMSMMGGTIELSSKRGQGSRFTARVRLPVARPPLEALTPKSVSAPDTSGLLGLHVLVVDDHPANRILLTSQLNALGCVIETANDGVAAFARWERQRQEGAPFDLILTDCSMPAMSGEDLARAIRAWELRRTQTREDVDVKATPIIGVTANAQPEALAQALAAGMTLCLVKPLDLDTLGSALVRATGAEQAVMASKAATVVASGDSFPASTRPLTVTSRRHVRSFSERTSNATLMHVSTAAIDFARPSVEGSAYGPTHNFPSNIVDLRKVLPARSAPGFYPGELNGADCDRSVPPRESPRSGDFNHATQEAMASPDAVPLFNAEQLDGFGDLSAALIKAVKSTNRQDLEEAQQVFALGDFHRLLELAHRMKGAAFVIGATSFADACLSLQRTCSITPGLSYDTAAIRTAYARFHDEATALDTALEQHPT